MRLSSFESFVTPCDCDLLWLCPARCQVPGPPARCQAHQPGSRHPSQVPDTPPTCPGAQVPGARCPGTQVSGSPARVPGTWVPGWCAWHPATRHLAPGTTSLLFFFTTSSTTC